MADQHKDHLLDHSYDGIQEYDNPLPRWWVWIFWATILFSLLYYVNVPGVGIGQGRIADYDADMARARALQAQREPAGGPTSEQLLALAADRGALAAARQLFTQNCAACHRADGGGMIGPNLADDHWLHGGTIVDVRRTIDEGVLAKGMPAWGKVLKPTDVNGLAAFVSTLRGTNPPNPKPPEGTKVSP
jgi:cytochrome c oxidase cbb3-type subunit 3